MTYREPGVYTEVITNRPAAGDTPNLMPVVIGEGPAFFDHEDIAMTRDTVTLYDVIPSTTVTAITEVYAMILGVKSVIAPSGNYSLDANNHILWVSEGPAVPAGGASYYISYEARPESTQYAVTWITDFDSLETAYGGHFMKTVTGGAEDTINPVSLGAYIALETGAAGVYVVQVEPATKIGETAYTVVMATDIVSALSKLSAIEGAYFLSLMSDDSTAVGLVQTHVNTMSATLERMERVCFVDKNISTPADTVTGFTSSEVVTAADLVSSIDEERVRIPFVTTVTKTLSDGNSYSLEGYYMCAALAGLASVIPVQRSLTRQSLYVFTTVNNMIGLTRTYKNALADAGFIVFDQPAGSGGPIIIRHGITTNAASVATREHSIITIKDYVAKYLRNSLETYIGKFNIDSFLVTKVNGTLTACKNFLVRKNILIDMVTTSVTQDEDNPDTLLVGVSINPPYPCNYIDVTIVVE